MAYPQKAHGNEKVRIQIDLTPAQAERFDQLVEDCELGSRKELFNAAMTLFNWAARDVVAKGRKIAAFDTETETSETVVMPALEHIRPRSEARAGRRLEVVHATDAPEPADI